MFRIGITGICGNLGWKLAYHLLSQPQEYSVIGLDANPLSNEQLGQIRDLPSDRLQHTICDLANGNDTRWLEALGRCDALVHLAAQNPYPEASWEDANRSFDMTCHLALAAIDTPVKRFVFATSNHVMGRYKDPPLAATIGPGQLTTGLPHAVGTLWNTGIKDIDSTPYAVAKSSGERICHAAAQRCGGRVSFVCVRIGWCQPGENSPATLSAAGTPTQETSSEPREDLEISNQWYRQMWLSNRDYCSLMEGAIVADSARWPTGCIVVNGMSNNTGMKWSLEESRTWLQYDPVDNVDAS